MRVIKPQVGAATPTISRTLARLRPVGGDAIDAGLLMIVVMVALVGLRTTFSTPHYLAVAALGLLLGVGIAHISTALRWPWGVALVAVALTYLGLGGAVALREDVIAGFLPSVRTLEDLLVGAVAGWKDLLTTLPPVAGDGRYLMLIWLFALLAGAGGMLVARRVRGAWPGAVIPLLVMAVVILLGTVEGAHLTLIGVLITLLAFGWTVIRYSRRRRLGSGGGRFSRALTAGILLVACVAGGVLTSTLLPGGHVTPRVVLRSYVEPPFDVQKFPSPLAGFRKYSSDGQRLYDEPLLEVAGAQEDSLVRIAVLDDYSGTAWSASGGGVGDPRAGFRRVGSVIPGAPEGRTDTVRITVLGGYAAATDLNVWVPGTGPATDLTFKGENAREHRASVRYNLGTGQALLPDRLKAGDVIEVTAVALPSQVPALPSAEGPVTVPEETSAFLLPAAERLGEKAGDPWSRAVEIARMMRENGSWSNGTKAGEQQYLPGHGQGRLLAFADDLVGSDEHYAAAYALMLNQLGYPARVVLGATVEEDGVVYGRDVRAWVEVSLADLGWVTIPTEVFMPDRSKQPNLIPPRTLEQQNAVDVPPPAPERPPGSFDSLFNTGAPGDLFENPEAPFDWWGLVLAVARILGPPSGLLATGIGLLLGAKLLRRERRRRRGATTTRVDGGWREFVDRARDLGRVVPARATRMEQARAVGGAEAAALASLADRAVFGVGEPDPTIAESYWSAVMASRKAALAGLPRWRRWAVALNPRSLIPLARDRRSAAGGHQPLRTSR
ncbi:MAG: transglutaminase-like domain-containing protein [Propioniciclava sp.]